MGVHPWRLLRSLPHLELVWHDGGPMGWTDFATLISLRRGMSHGERRTTLLHELLHVERGPVPAGLAAKEEERVERATARLLLPDVQQIGEALAWAHSLEEAAEELAVDAGALLTRLRWLHPAERSWLEARLADG